MNGKKVPLWLQIFLVNMGLMLAWALSGMLFITNIVAWGFFGLVSIVLHFAIGFKYRHAIDQWFPNKKKEKDKQ